jgi:phage baseplate assembly protein W
MAQAVRPTDEQLYGKDLSVTSDGDLNVQTANGLADLSVVSGRPNLQQAILIRLMTDPGELPMQRTYGSHLGRVGSDDMRSAKELAFKFASEGLRDEPRVEKVVSAQLQDTAYNAFDLNLVVKLLGSDTPLNLVYPGYLK